MTLAHLALAQAVAHTTYTHTHGHDNSDWSGAWLLAALFSIGILYCVFMESSMCMTAPVVPETRNYTKTETKRESGNKTVTTVRYDLKV